MQLDGNVKFKKVVLVHFALIILVLRITSGAKMWLKTFIIVTLDLKNKKTQ